MRLAIFCSTLLVAAGVTATATPVNDPEMEIDTGGFSTPISTTIGTAQPCDPGPLNLPCSYDFFNDTGSLLTSFTFETKINPGLSSEIITQNFTCVDPSGYFAAGGSPGCAVNYIPNAIDPLNPSAGPFGDLKYVFSAVNPPDGDETSQSELGEGEGIPAGGHFMITFKGWKPDLTVTVNNMIVPLYSGEPMTDNSFQTVPEPAAAGSLLVGFMLLAAMWRRRVAR